MELLKSSTIMEKGGAPPWAYTDSTPTPAATDAPDPATLQA